MGKTEVRSLFIRVGASAATAEAKKDSVGEFGIGVMSYFMAGHWFVLKTYDGKTEPVALSFDRGILSGGPSTALPATQNIQGTTITIHIRDVETFDLLLESYPHWCRDVEGLSAQLLPERRLLSQKGTSRLSGLAFTKLPHWVERAHLGPVSDPTRWEAMTGASTVDVLYRGVFVQEFEVRGLWGIEGSIDVDPKHFKPRLNREGFIKGQLQTEVTEFLRSIHPVILEAMAARLAAAVEKGSLDKWTEKRWANLWLSIPREVEYANATKLCDSVFRSLPAFELAAGNQWRPASLEKIAAFQTKVFVAPLADDNSTDLVQAAVRLLRNTSQAVIRGIRRDKSWMRYANRSFGTTAELISSVFAEELPQLVLIVEEAEQILAQIATVAPMFTGPPPVHLVSLGPDSLPVLRLRGRLVINLDHQSGKALVEDVLRENSGPITLVGSAARHCHEQLTQVAAVVREITSEPEILGPIRRRYIREFLS